MQFSVYKHTSPNGKVYIGITRQIPQYRWSNGNGYKANKHFYNAIKKYGWDNFKHEILYSNVSAETAYFLEIGLILLHRSNNPKYGYNKSFGGEHGCTGATWNMSDEHKRKISEALTGRTGELSTNYGKKYSEEHRKHISEGKLGKPSKLKGKPLFESHKLNISNSKLGKPQYHKRVKVVCIDLDRVFECASDAGKCLNIDSSSIIKCCKGKRKTAGGYRWSYEI